MNIIGKRIIFRAIEEKDASLMQTWANDPSIQRMLGGWHFPVGIKDQMSWISLLKCNSVNQKYVIELIDTNIIIGYTNLVSIDWKNRSAYTGLLIGDGNYRGKGLGVESVMTMMRYAFDELGLQNLDTEIIENNFLSLKTYVDNCGWIIQGTKKGWYFRNGKRWNKIILGINNNEYRELIKINKYWD